MKAMNALQLEVTPSWGRKAWILSRWYNVITAGQYCKASLSVFTLFKETLVQWDLQTQTTPSWNHRLLVLCPVLSSTPTSTWPTSPWLGSVLFVFSEPLSMMLSRKTVSEIITDWYQWAQDWSTLAIIAEYLWLIWWVFIWVK